jgi:hypothetical protein
MHRQTPLPLEARKMEDLRPNHRKQSGVVSETMNRSPSLHANYFRHQCNSPSLPQIRDMTVNPFELIADRLLMYSMRRPAAELALGLPGQHSAHV